MIRTLFYKFVTQIFILLALALWFMLAGVHFYANQYEGIVLILFAMIQVFIGGFCGLLIQRLHQGNFKDPLTGIGNRGYFYEKLGQEIKRSKRAGSPVSLVFIDIDNFKTVNDTFGHIQGDKVLVQLAGILKETVRGADSVGRWGGEEFAIILPDTGSEGAVALAERLRRYIAAFNFECKVTISAGVATNTGHIDLDKFVSMADDALYSAKNQRNSVVEHNSVIEENLICSN